MVSQSHGHSIYLPLIYLHETKAFPWHDEVYHAPDEIAFVELAYLFGETPRLRIQIAVVATEHPHCPGSVVSAVWG